MPPVIAAIVDLLWIVTNALGPVLGPMLFSLGASMALGAISKMFAKGPSSSSLTSQLGSRTVTSRQAIAPWRVLYGSNRVGGIITFLHTTGATNQFLHLVVTLAGHEVNAISAMYFDGIQVPLDGSGNATGNFAGFVHAEFNLGRRPQAAFAGLLAAAPAYWDATHRQRNRAGAYVQLTWDATKFPNGVPNITFDVQGRKVYDPRSGAIAYSDNAALCIADYLNNASFGLLAQTKYPVTAGMLSQSGLGTFNAANCVDADVTTHGFDTVSAAIGSYLRIDLGAGNAQEFRRFRIYHDTGSPALNAVLDVLHSDDDITYTGCDESYGLYASPVDVLGWNEAELFPNGAHRYWKIQVAVNASPGGVWNEIEFYTSDVDSTLLTAAANTCDEQVNILPSGTQNRFSIDGSFDTSEAPSAVIGRMNSAMAGSVLYVAGKWGIYPGIWRAPTISLSDADFRGPMTVQTRLTHRDLYNGVKGTFISPQNNWQAADYPPFQSAAYLQEDNNEPLWLDVELPFTTNGAMAQRLSKIALRRARHQITVQGQFKLTAYQVQPLDVIQLSHARFGWTNKTFEVTACTLSYTPDPSGAPALGVDLTLREADSTIYDWSTADEIALSAPPAPILPQNAVAQPITGLGVNTVEIVRVADGVRTSFVGLTWTAPADSFVTSGGHIRVQYKKHADSLWTDGGKLDGAATKGQVGPVIDGTSYDVQLWAENTSGVRSSTASATFTPTGTAVTLDTISDGTIFVRGIQYQSQTIIVPNSNFEASASLPVPGWYANNATLSYETGSPYSGSQSLKVTASTQYGAALSVQKWACNPGDKFYLSTAMKSDGTASPYAQLFFADKTGAFLGDVSIHPGTGASWAVGTASGTAPANTVFCYVALGNSNVGGTGICWFDNIIVDRILSLDTNVADGSTYARPLASRLSSGKPWIDFSEGIHANKNVDNIGDGSTYARPLAAALYSGSLKAAHLSNQAVGQRSVGATLCQGSPGTNQVFSGWKTVASATINIPSGTSSVKLHCMLPSQPAGSGSSETGIGFAIASSDPGSPQVSHTGVPGGAGWSGDLTLNSPTIGNGLTLFLYVQGSGTNDSLGTTAVSVLSQTVVQILDSGVLT